MTDRQFRLLLCMALLVLLHLDSVTGMAALIACLTCEGITNWRITRLTSQYFHDRDEFVRSVQTLQICLPVRTSFEAERALRLMFALILVCSVYAYPDKLRWLAWFVTFAVVGAGISGIYPTLTTLRLPGFR